MQALAVIIHSLETLLFVNHSSVFTVQYSDRGNSLCDKIIKICLLESLREQKSILYQHKVLPTHNHNSPFQTLISGLISGIAICFSI